MDNFSTVYFLKTEKREQRAEKKSVKIKTIFLRLESKRVSIITSLLSVMIFRSLN